MSLLKSRLIALVMGTWLFICSSCSIIGGDDYASYKIEQLIHNIENKDVKKSLDLFAPNIKKNAFDLESKMKRVISEFHGSYEKILERGASESKEQDGTKVIRFYDYLSWNVKTSETLYYFRILWCFHDSYDSNNVGIWNFIMEEHKAGQEAIKTDYKEWTEGSKYRGITFAGDEV